MWTRVALQKHGNVMKERTLGSLTAIPGLMMKVSTSGRAPVPDWGLGSSNCSQSITMQMRRIWTINHHCLRLSGVLYRAHRSDTPFLVDAAWPPMRREEGRGDRKAGRPCQSSNAALAVAQLDTAPGPARLQTSAVQHVLPRVRFLMLSYVLRRGSVLHMLTARPSQQPRVYIAPSLRLLTSD